MSEIKITPELQQQAKDAPQLLIDKHASYLVSLSDAVAKEAAFRAISEESKYNKSKMKYYQLAIPQWQAHIDRVAAALKLEGYSYVAEKWVKE